MRGVRDQIVAETGGNPLALLELPVGKTAAEPTGGFELPSALPLLGRIEEQERAELRLPGHDSIVCPRPASEAARVGLAVPGRADPLSAFRATPATGSP